MGNHASTEELIARAKAQLERLTAKQNAEAINQLPQVVAIDAEINSENNRALKWKRWGAEAPNKVASFQARVNEWIERGEKADAWLEDYKVRVADLRKQREAIVRAEASKM